MPEYQKRVIEERVYLIKKIGRLKDFVDSKLYEDLGLPEKHRLRAQLMTMETYSEILRQRIEAFQ